MRKRLLYVAPHLSTGGQPQYLYKQLKHFINDFDIEVVEINNSGGDAFVVPMTWQVHHDQHTMSELEFYCKHNINPIEVCKMLARETTCSKINKLYKEGYYDYYIKEYADRQASAKSTLGF